MSYEIIRYRPEFRRDVIELETGLWTNDHQLNSAYFSWKYEQNPYSHEPLVYLAVCHGRIVGVRGVFGMNFVVGATARPLQALGAGDLMIEPDHRNSGLFNRIMRHAVEELRARGCRVVLNLSGGAVTQLASLASGWRSAGVLRVMQWTRTRGRQAGTRDCVGQIDEYLGAEEPCGSAGRVVVSRHPWAEEMAQASQLATSTHGIRHLRDRQYFSWRFNNPLRSYRYLFYLEDTLQGYLVLSSTRAPSDRGVQIVDWNGTGPVLSALLQRAISWGRFTRLETWSGSHRSAQSAALEQAGFSDQAAPGGVMRHRPHLLVAAVTSNGWKAGRLDLLEQDHWHLQMADSDLY